VVEEDLAELFGRGRITDSVSSSFREELSRSDPPVSLVGGLSLMRGPGPTVSRALVEPVYFSTIVQCMSPLPYPGTDSSHGGERKIETQHP
jgi:hypothetical protein